MIIGLAGYVDSVLEAAVGRVFDGVSIGDRNNKETWIVHWKPEATPQQVASGLSVIQALNYDAYVQAEEQRENDIKNDAGRRDLLDRLHGATNAQIDTWIENNVTSLASARTVLKAIVKVLSNLV